MHLFNIHLKSLLTLAHLDNPCIHQHADLLCNHWILHVLSCCTRISLHLLQNLSHDRIAKDSLHLWVVLRQLLGLLARLRGLNLVESAVCLGHLSLELGSVLSLHVDRHCFLAALDTLQELALCEQHSSFANVRFDERRIESDSAFTVLLRFKDCQELGIASSTV